MTNQQPSNIQRGTVGVPLSAGKYELGMYGIVWQHSGRAFAADKRAAEMGTN
jgi:hypothetical protein